jgi:hypothetical protein
MAEGHGRGGAFRAGSNHPRAGLAPAPPPPYPRKGVFWLAFMSPGLGVLSFQG